MVYRVSRILNLPNLPSLVFKAESELFGSGMSGPFDHGGSYLSGQALQLSVAQPSQLLELEGPNFGYIPFFSEQMKYSVS